jgi:hypothetical protein
MHYKVPAITSYVNEHTIAFRFRRIDGDTHVLIVEALACSRIELPAVPGAAEDGRAGELVAAGLSADTLPHSSQAERAAVMRAAVAHTAQLAVHCDDPDLAASDPRDDVAVALEVGDRADVLPAHARASPSRSP